MKPRSNKRRLPVASNKNDSSSNVICRYQTYDTSTRSWSDWHHVQRPSDCSATNLTVPCPRGSIQLYPNVISATDRTHLRQELAGCNYFRAYGIQGGTEPRRHFLAHELADDDNAFDSCRPQPGYRYNRNTICLKARSLAKLPRLQQLSSTLQATCGVDQWTIGINPVCYRDSSDSIAPHADDNQNETLIVAVVVYQQEDDDDDDFQTKPVPRDDDSLLLPPAKSLRSRQPVQQQQSAAKQARVASPATPCTKPAVERRRRRVVKIEPQNYDDLVQGDVIVELYLKPGDAYSMDGELQLHYFHSVPKLVSPVTNIKSQPLQPPTCPNNLRLAVVFRCGDPLLVTRDSGTPSDWAPKPPLLRLFGRHGIAGLQEGHLYTKSQLVHMGAHEGLQKGVSGNKQHGCNAIAVSGLRPDGKGDDNDFCQLQWFVEYSNGGAAMWMSAVRQLPIRVFRSSDLNSIFRAHAIDNKPVKSFRYDGLYRVTNVGVEAEDTSIVWVMLEAGSAVPLLDKKALCSFQLQRVEKGDGAMQNQFSHQELVLRCLRSKVMSLTTPFCSCYCTESKRCKYLQMHSDQALCDTFLYIWGLSDFKFTPHGYRTNERLEIKGGKEAFVESELERVRLMPRKLHWSSKAQQKKHLQGASQYAANTDAHGFAHVDSAVITTPKANRRTVSPDASDSSVSYRQPRSKALIARPGEQVAAWVNLDDSNEGYQYILAVVHDYDEQADSYIVSDVDCKPRARGESSKSCGPPIFTLPRSQVRRLSKELALEAGTRCLAIYPDMTVFYRAVVVRRRRDFADPGASFHILAFDNEDETDERGRIQHYAVLSQYVLVVEEDNQSDGGSEAGAADERDASVAELFCADAWQTNSQPSDNNSMENVQSYSIERLTL